MYGEPERQHPPREQIYPSRTMVRYHDPSTWPSLHDGEIFRVIGRRLKGEISGELEYEIVNQWGETIWTSEYHVEIVGQSGEFPLPDE